MAVSWIEAGMKHLLLNPCLYSHSLKCSIDKCAQRTFEHLTNPQSHHRHRQVKYGKFFQYAKKQGIEYAHIT